MEIIEQSHEILSHASREDVYKLIEKAGRTAYKSEDRITEGSAEKFIRMLRDKGHESVLEHFNIIVKFVTDRGITHEIVRHRLVSYTQESTRYCNYGSGNIKFIKPTFWNIDSAEFMLWKDAMERAEFFYQCLMNNTYNSKPQYARSVLPNSLKTEIVCTANIREWRHILRLRTSQAAHPQIRALMLPLLSDFKEWLPALFDDIKTEEEI